MSEPGKKSLFVAMPFGKKTASLDAQKPKELVEIDFDRVWEKIIAPGIPDEFNAIRVDQTRFSGIIDKVYIEHLLNAEVVLADLTFANPNVYYELGIRHALRKGGAVLVAQIGAVLPFDIQKLNVLWYDRQDATSVIDFHAKLRSSILRAFPHVPESPVHVFLPGLFVCKYDPQDSPDTVISRLKAQVDELERLVEELKSNAREARLLDQVKEMTRPQELLATYHQLSHSKATPLRIIEILGTKLHQNGFFKEAIGLFMMAIEHHGPDAVILRELGFCHRKQGPQHFDEAMKYFQEALKIRPFDSELRGMIGGMYKRQKKYELALEQYQEANRVFPNFLYTLVNLGAVCAFLSRESEARQHYEAVARLCHEKLNTEATDYWNHLCLGEALAYLGDEAGALKAYRAAVDIAPPVEHVRSALEQLQYFAAIPSAEDVARPIINMLEEYVKSHSPSSK